MDIRYIGQTKIYRARVHTFQSCRVGRVLKYRVIQVMTIGTSILLLRFFFWLPILFSSLSFSPYCLLTMLFSTHIYHPRVYLNIYIYIKTTFAISCRRGGPPEVAGSACCEFKRRDTNYESLEHTRWEQIVVAFETLWAMTYIVTRVCPSDSRRSENPQRLNPHTFYSILLYFFVLPHSNNRRDRIESRGKKKSGFFFSISRLDLSIDHWGVKKCWKREKSERLYSLRHCGFAK